MTKLILRWVVVAVAVWVAILIVPGIEANPSDWTTIAGIAVILGLLNAIVRPVLKLLSCPLIVLTLGFTVRDFWAAFLGALVVSVVSALLNLLVRDDNESRR